MKSSKGLVSLLVLVAGLGLALVTGTSRAQEPAPGTGAAPQGSLGSGFTYQGQLKAGGAPVAGTCDLRFWLYDALAGGAQVGPLNELTGVEVAGGLLTVNLDFGAGAFSGDARYLQIAVRCPAGSGSYATLSPRQALTAAPYALYALGTPWGGLRGLPAGFADGIDDVAAVVSGTNIYAGEGLSQLAGENSVTVLVDFGGSGTASTVARSDHDHDGRYYTQSQLQTSGAAGVHWGNLTNVPAGLSDGDDDTTYSAGTGLSLAGTQFSVDTVAIQRRVTGTCPGGSAIRVIGSDGAVTCESVGGGASWSLSGNSGTTPGTNFLGTSDNVALQLHVNGARALRLEPGSSPNLVGGYSGNTVTAGVVGATIDGGGASGLINRVTDDYGTVGGGRGNRAGDNAGTTSDGAYAAVGGGRDNFASGGYATIAGGYGNLISGDYATIGGGGRTDPGNLGTSNRVSDDYGTVGGGGNNQAGDNAGTTADAPYATVGGGRDNIASNWYAAVGGGYGNLASGNRATIAGGYDNTASGSRASVGGGTGNTASDWYTSVGGGTNNTASASRATVSGGSYNQATAPYATIGGGGGDSSTTGNRVTDEYGTVGGGYNNQAGNNAGTTADATYAIVGGGRSNTASSWYAAVGGGYGNTASGGRATVGGGGFNTAGGECSVVAGGCYSAALADYSFAAGHLAIADRRGCFVWGDATEAEVRCEGENQFVVRSSGGVYLSTDGGRSSGVHLASGSSSWSQVSDREAKENFTAVDVRRVLARLAEIPISTWNYKTQDATVRHMGPVAQDLYAAFGLGEDARHVSTVDADGVALAAIQGLYHVVQEQAGQIDALQGRVDALEARLDRLEGGSGGAGSARLPGYWPLLAGLCVGAAVIWRRHQGGGQQ
jgi:hypothetical protein